MIQNVDIFGVENEQHVIFLINKINGKNLFLKNY